MKYIDINKRYTEIVADYISAGYIINTASMSGSQGEIAKIDLTDGSEIVRIIIERFNDWEIHCNGIEIIVGKATDNVKPHSNDIFGTIWNDHLDIIRTERFYCIDNYGKDYYGTFDDAKAANEKRTQRYVLNRQKETYTPSEEAMQVAKRIIRKKMGYKRIDEAGVSISKVKNGYMVSYRGKHCIVR